MKQMRTAWKADDSSMPFILAGSGTLGMEMTMQNLLEQGNRALVLSIGYFGDRFIDMAKRISGVEYHVEKSEIGKAFTREQVSNLFQQVRITHYIYVHVELY